MSSCPMVIIRDIKKQERMNSFSISRKKIFFQCNPLNLFLTFRYRIACERTLTYFWPSLLLEIPPRLSAFAGSDFVYIARTRKIHTKANYKIISEFQELSLSKRA